MGSATIPGVPSGLRWILAIGLTGAILLAPAAADATLVFVRNPIKPVVFTAGNDGSGARRLAPGSGPRLSPDGSTVAYLSPAGGKSDRPNLMTAPVDGSAPPRMLIAGWREDQVFAWSPDSEMIAAVRGPEVGPQHLVVVELASGAQRTIATGFFNGVSFAPDGGQLVYSKVAGKEQFSLRSDIYRLSLAGGAPVRITHDQRSASPLWGPGGTIVFVKRLGAKQRRYGPKNDLFLMNGSGGDLHRLTHTKVGPLVQGLTPTEWSADGSRLLAEFGGEDTSFAVAVNPRSGAERTLSKAGEAGFIGTAISADGSTVLGEVGGFGAGPGHNVVSIPYGGGKPTVLARNAFEPDWSR